MAGDDHPFDPPERPRIRLDPDHITLDGVDLDALDGPSGDGPGGDFGLGDLDDAEWGLSDDDLALGRYLKHRRHRRGRLFRLVAVVVVIAFVLLEVFTYLGRRTTHDEVQQDADTAEHSDFGPTSAEMSHYLLPAASSATADAGLVASPGNGEDGTYDNRSLEELDAGGPSAATYGAEAGVVRTWTAGDGRSFVVGIYLFDDRPAAASAHERFLTAAAGAGGRGSEAIDQFAVVGAPDRHQWFADRAIDRFLITVELTAPDGDAIARSDLVALVHATAAVAGAVH